MKRAALMLLSLSLLLLPTPHGFESAAQPGSLHCINFPSNATVDFPGYPSTCAYWGSGCLECWTECEGGQPCDPAGGGGGGCDPENNPGGCTPETHT